MEGSGDEQEPAIYTSSCVLPQDEDRLSQKKLEEEAAMRRANKKSFFLGSCDSANHGFCTT
jgi:hypothetical protein